MRRRIGVDLDNTLCVGKHWNTQEECLKAEPIQDMIDYVNKLYKDDFIIIYTARQNFLMSATFQWLDDNDVYYHAVSNRKVPFDLVIDDTAMNSKEVKIE
jgi:hypothetical protein